VCSELLLSSLNVLTKQCESLLAEDLEEKKKHVMESVEREVMMVMIVIREREREER
jgi:hypothetical protein